MHYSSDSSDSENMKDFTSLDFSYLLWDSETVGLHLRNSILESLEVKQNKQTQIANIQLPNETFSASPQSDINESTDRSVRRRIHDQGVNYSRNSEFNELRDMKTEKILVHHNIMVTLPIEVINFPNLRHLDLSNNNFSHVNDFLLSLTNLQTLYMKNNELSDDSLPKDLELLKNLRELNLSGNKFTQVPSQIYKLTSLKYFYMANNEIQELLPDIKNLQNLQILHLGGNSLVKVPDELGNLRQLGVLALCDNKLRRLPRVISNLTKLRSLLLHKNNMCCLPVEIVKLRGLAELSLRDNPLVNKFINCCAKEILHTPPSLLELSARTIKLRSITYEQGCLPKCLNQYIHSGQKCVNPKCKGVYFTSCVEHVKFVDFCGKYRVPLMHYLCSAKCSSTTPSVYQNRIDSESEDEVVDTLRKVLLG